MNSSVPLLFYHDYLQAIRHKRVILLSFFSSVKSHLLAFKALYPNLGLPDAHVMILFGGLSISFTGSSLVAQSVKNLPVVQETWVRKIPCRRKWQPTPVFLLGEPHGQRSLAGYSPWGRKSRTWLRIRTYQHTLIFSWTLYPANHLLSVHRDISRSFFFLQLHNTPFFEWLWIIEPVSYVCTCRLLPIFCKCKHCYNGSAFVHVLVCCFESCWRVTFKIYP